MICTSSAVRTPFSPRAPTWPASMCSQLRLAIAAGPDRKHSGEHEPAGAAASTEGATVAKPAGAATSGPQTGNEARTEPLDAAVKRSPAKPRAVVSPVIQATLTEHPSPPPHISPLPRSLAIRLRRCASHSPSIRLRLGIASSSVHAAQLVAQDSQETSASSASTPSGAHVDSTAEQRSGIGAASSTLPPPAEGASLEAERPLAAEVSTVGGSGGSERLEQQMTKMTTWRHRFNIKYSTIFSHVHYNL